MENPAILNPRIGFKENETDNFIICYEQQDGKKSTYYTLQNKKPNSRFQQDMLHEGLSSDYTLAFEERQNADQFICAYQENRRLLVDPQLGHKLSEEARKALPDNLIIMPISEVKRLVNQTSPITPSME